MSARTRSTLKITYWNPQPYCRELEARVLLKQIEIGKLLKYSFPLDLCAKQLFDAVDDSCGLHDVGVPFDGEH